MSVRGEFQRILGDTTADLRVRGCAALADALERDAARAGDALEDRAHAVLSGIEAAAGAGALDAALLEALDHLRAICRVIVGPQALQEAARR